MFFNIIKRLNWVDIVIIAIVLRTCYVGAKRGFVVEFFKLLGIIVASYVSFHYYTILSDALRDRFYPERFPLEFLDFIIFFALVIISYLSFVLLRSVFLHFVKMEAVPALSKWGGFMLGLARGILMASLFVYMLVISTIPYLYKSTQKSYKGKEMFTNAIAAYTQIWDGVMSKFMVKEKFNATVKEVEEGFNENNETD